MGTLLHSLETGETGMERASGTTVFDYLAHEPQEASYFNDAMIGFHGAEPHAVAAAYDSPAATLSSTSAAAPAICWQPFSSAILGRVAFWPTCRTSCARPEWSSSHAVLRIA